MKPKFKIIARCLVLVALIGAPSLIASSAWATVSFIKPQDATIQVAVVKKSDIPQQASSRTKTRAPEPTTLALFGSGLCGMIVRFVRKTYSAAKRAFDVIASVLGLIILSPLFVLAAILVKITSKGPIIFSQTRVGKNGRHFEMYKFRTMKRDAEKETGPVWAAANDSRLTPIGRFLRKWRIDELPQFVNILKGEMSLIGPRPERPVFVDKFKEIIPNYETRLTVNPGITGLAQVWHRYDETIQDVKKKVRYDRLYIKNVCFSADFRIALRTFRVVLLGEGAR